MRLTIYVCMRCILFLHNSSTFCVHFRQHDVRMSLNQFQVVKEGNPLFGVAQRMLKTLRFFEPGMLHFLARTHEWSVNYIRKKSRTSYIIDGKYITTISAVREHIVKSQSQQQGEYTVNLQECREHFEVEVRHIHLKMRFIANRHRTQ